MPALASKARLDASRIARQLTRQSCDHDALAQCHVDPAQIADDYFDYSKVVVKKPWGYEYLIFQNAEVAVWILYVKAGASTSMHCHLRKKTSITILSGKALCCTLTQSTPRLAGEGMLIGEGVFHQTRADSPEGVFLMEIESPVNKRDLVRFKDAYGREGQGYESTDHMTVNLSNYNYISFATPGIYYNVRKRFHDTTIHLVRAESPRALSSLVDLSQADLVGVFNGRILDADNHTICGTGDLLDCQTAIGSTHHVESGFEAVVISTQDRSTRCSDFIVAHLKARKINAFFFAPDTSSGHLVDAIARETELNFIPQTSDFGAAFAAVAHAKITGQPACCILSSGASGTRALTAVADAWTDSAPVLFLSAQSRLSSLGATEGSRTRQLANKELPITAIARPITKNSAAVADAAGIRDALDRALLACMSDRKGPAWLDLPIDILGMKIDPGAQRTAHPPVIQPPILAPEKIERVCNLLQNAARPVLLVGHGVRAAGADADLARLISQLGIPVLCSRRGADLLADDHPLHFGRPGTYGQRSANFIIQNCDLLLSVGTRHSLPLISRNIRSFARAATKIVVDIDPDELGKHTLTPDLGIVCDAGHFIRCLLEALRTRPFTPPAAWLARCRRWRAAFPTENEHPAPAARGVNPYRALARLSQQLTPDTIILAEGGSCVDYAMQSFVFKSGQRLITSSGLETHGFALSGAIGACLASRKHRAVCLCESGGFLQNIAEAAAIVQSRLPVCLFVFCAATDARLRQMQTGYFGGRRVEATAQHDTTDQALKIFSQLYQTPIYSVRHEEELPAVLAHMLSSSAPSLCAVHLPEDFSLSPRLALTVEADGQWTSAPLEDMHPQLSRDALRAEMLIPLWGGSETTASAETP
jgi:acetolactate synthase I/II/III large subunit